MLSPSILTKLLISQGFYGGVFPQVKPTSTDLTFRTGLRVPKLGVMLVGWGGNNGTTVTAAVLANRLGLSWMTKRGQKVSEPFRVSVICVVFSERH